MTYSIEPVTIPAVGAAAPRTEYRVRDEAGRQVRGRFHTQAQAQAWIDSRPDPGTGRAAVHEADASTLSSRDYYGDNERLIREVSQS